MDQRKNQQRSPFDSIFTAYPHLARKIVKIIPLDLRFEVAAINKDFYGLVCDLDKRKHRMKIFGQACRGDSLSGSSFFKEFRSILNSNRQFDEMRIFRMDFNMMNLKQLIAIAQQHGEGIKKLLLSNCSMDVCRDYRLFGAFLGLLPNLEEWDFYDWHVPFYDHVKLRKDVMAANEFTFEIFPVLHNLKKLEISHKAGNFAHIFAQFIAPNSLQHLKLYWCPWTNFQEFIIQQHRLTSLDIEEEFRTGFFDANLLKHLKLEKFVSNNCSSFSDVASKNQFVQQLIQDHPKLRVIALNDLEWLDMSVWVTCHRAEQLESLTLQITNDNCTNLLEIVHLKHLKEIGINFATSFSRHDILDAFSKLHMPRIKVLIISRKLNEAAGFDVNETLSNFGRHWENIEELEYCGNQVTNEVKTVLENFGKLQMLDLDASISMEQAEKKCSSVINLKLNRVSGIDLSRILKALPNLISIVIEWHIEEKENLMMSLIGSLVDHRKLKHLKISFRFAKALAGTDLEVIKKLCQQVLSFKITFSSLLKQSLDHIASFIKNDHEICKMEQNSWDNGTDRIHALELLNLKF